MSIKVRDVLEKDCRNLWLWRNSPVVRSSSFSKGEILYEEHQRWFNEKIKDKNAKIYIAENNKGELIGQVRFDIEGDSKCFVNVNLNPGFIGKGFGSAVIECATKSFFKEDKRVDLIIAEIIEGNLASEKAFLRAGYIFKEEMNKKGKRVKVFSYSRR